ncbi:MAG: hypothetical protein WCT50_01720 [Patescibacteria group bacterium]
MKKIIILVVFLLTVNMVAFSQIKNIVATSDSSIVVNNVYAGLLNSTAFSSDLKAENFYNFRIGANATYQVVPWLKAKALVAYGRVEGKDININFFSFKVHSDKDERLGLELGHMPTLSTEMMPMPLCAAGQFGTWAEGRITKPAVGAKTTWKINKKNLIGAEIAIRNEKPEYHLKIESGIFKAASSYVTANEKLQTNEKFQAIVSAKTERVYSIAVFDRLADSKMLANFTSVSIGNDFELCLDAGYEFNSKKFEKLEFGILKNFESHFVKGLFYLCYKQEIKSIEATLLIHI